MNQQWRGVLRHQARYRVWSEGEVKEAFWSGVVYGACLGIIIMTGLTVLW